jgi:hypothetical protein
MWLKIGTAPQNLVEAFHTDFQQHLESLFMDYMEKSFSDLL